MMMQLLFTLTYTFKCCNSKLTDSGFGASEFMLETQLLGKVCNSLKLRMGIRIADVTECLLHHKQQLTAISGGYSLLMQIMQLYNNTSAPPNTNPVWVDLVQSGRSDFVTNTQIS
jgi:hypothetical protein